MNENKQQEFINYLTSQYEELAKKEKTLRMDQRKDEANHVRVQMNIVQIFQTVFQVSLKKANGNSVKENFLDQLEKIPESWEKALENARAHQNVEQELIENLKFQMRDSIREQFLKVVNQ